VTSTHSGGRPVDLDLLADYLEGALTPDEAAQIADLVDNDPAWAETLTALTAVLPLVNVQLSAYAAETPPMPSELADRITTSLQALAPDADRRAAARPAPSRPAGERPPAGRPPTASTPRRRRGFMQNRWLQAAAVLIIFFGGLSVVIKLGSNSTSENSTTSGSAKAGAGSVAPNLPDMSTRPGLVLTASGKDYNSATLTGTVPAPAFTAHLAAPSGGEAAPRAPASVPTPLSRLLDPSALNDCLTAVEATTGGTTTSVDFASYQGQPALIVDINTPATVVVVGPDCGLPGRGADEITRH